MDKPLGTLHVACSLNEQADHLEGSELVEGLVKRHVSFHSPLMMEEHGLKPKDMDAVLLSPDSRAFFRRPPMQYTFGTPHRPLLEQMYGTHRRLIDEYMDMKKPVVVLDPDCISANTYENMIVCKTWWEVFQEIVKIQTQKGVTRV